MSNMNRWDKAREADPAPVTKPPVDPNAGDMTQAQFFKQREKTPEEKKAEADRLAAALRSRR